MALQTFPGGLTATPPSFSFTPTYSTTALMDASTEKVEFVFSVPKTGTLDKIEFRVGTCTFNAASALRVSFQDLAAVGDADGTQDQYRGVTGLTSNTWQVPGLMTSDGTDTGVKRSVTRGQILAVVFEYQTFTAADSVIISAINKATFAHLPYQKLYTGTWGNLVNNGPVMALKYDDGSYAAIPGCFPLSAVNQVAFNSASTPDERGLYFQMPMPTRITGAFVFVDPTSTARTISILLYAQASDTPLTTLTLDGDHFGNINTSRGGWFIFPDSVLLTANTNYRLAVRPDVTSNINLWEFDVNAAALMDAMEGGQTWHHTSRTNGATTGGTLGDGWTQTTTKRPWISPIFDQFDDGASTGGGMIQSRVQLGM